MSYSLYPEVKEQTLALIKEESQPFDEFSKQLEALKLEMATCTLSKLWRMGSRGIVVTPTRTDTFKVFKKEWLSHLKSLEMTNRNSIIFKFFMASSDSFLRYLAELDFERTDDDAINCTEIELIFLYNMFVSVTENADLFTELNQTTAILDKFSEVLSQVLDKMDVIIKREDRNPIQRWFFQNGLWFLDIYGRFAQKYHVKVDPSLITKIQELISNGRESDSILDNYADSLQDGLKFLGGDMVCAIEIVLKKRQSICLAEFDIKGAIAAIQIQLKAIKDFELRAEYLGFFPLLPRNFKKETLETHTLSLISNLSKLLSFVSENSSRVTLVEKMKGRDDEPIIVRQLPDEVAPSREIGILDTINRISEDAKREYFDTLKEVFDVLNRIVETDSSNILAHFYLTFFHYEGLGVERDIDKVIGYARKLQEILDKKKSLSTKASSDSRSKPIIRRRLYRSGNTDEFSVKKFQEIEVPTQLAILAEQVSERLKAPLPLIYCNEEELSLVPMRSADSYDLTRRYTEENLRTFQKHLFQYVERPVVFESQNDLFWYLTYLAKSFTQGFRSEAFNVSADYKLARWCIDFILRNQQENAKFISESYIKNGLFTSFLVRNVDLGNPEDVVAQVSWFHSLFRFWGAGDNSLELIATHQIEILKRYLQNDATVRKSGWDSRSISPLTDNTIWGLFKKIKSIDGWQTNDVTLKFIQNIAEKLSVRRIYAQAFFDNFSEFFQYLYSDAADRSSAWEDTVEFLTTLTRYVPSLRLKEIFDDQEQWDQLANIFLSKYKAGRTNLKILLAKLWGCVSDDKRRDIEAALLGEDRAKKLTFCIEDKEQLDFYTFQGNQLVTVSDYLSVGVSREIRNPLSLGISYVLKKLEDNADSRISLDQLEPLLSQFPITTRDQTYASLLDMITEDNLNPKTGWEVGTENLEKFLRIWLRVPVEYLRLPIFNDTVAEKLKLMISQLPRNEDTKDFLENFISILSGMMVDHFIKAYNPLESSFDLSLDQQTLKFFIWIGEISKIAGVSRHVFESTLEIFSGTRGLKEGKESQSKDQMDAMICRILSHILNPEFSYSGDENPLLHCPSFPSEDREVVLKTIQTLRGSFQSTFLSDLLFSKNWSIWWAETIDKQVDFAQEILSALKKAGVPITGMMLSTLIGLSSKFVEAQIDKCLEVFPKILSLRSQVEINERPALDDVMVNIFDLLLNNSGGDIATLNQMFQLIHGADIDEDFYLQLLHRTIVQHNWDSINATRFIIDCNLHHYLARIERWPQKLCEKFEREPGGFDPQGFLTFFDVSRSDKIEDFLNNPEVPMYLQTFYMTYHMRRLQEFCSKDLLKELIRSWFRKLNQQMSRGIGDQSEWFQIVQAFSILLNINLDDEKSKELMCEVGKILAAEENRTILLDYIIAGFRSLVMNPTQKDRVRKFLQPIINSEDVEFSQHGITVLAQLSFDELISKWKSYALSIVYSDKKFFGKLKSILRTVMNRNEKNRTQFCIDLLVKQKAVCTAIASDPSVPYEVIGNFISDMALILFEESEKYGNEKDKNQFHKSLFEKLFSVRNPVQYQVYGIIIERYIHQSLDKSLEKKLTDFAAMMPKNSRLKVVLDAMKSKIKKVKSEDQSEVQNFVFTILRNPNVFFKTVRNKNKFQSINRGFEPNAISEWFAAIESTIFSTIDRYSKSSSRSEYETTRSSGAATPRSVEYLPVPGAMGVQQQPGTMVAGPAGWAGPYQPVAVAVPVSEPFPGQVGGQSLEFGAPGGGSPSFWSTAPASGVSFPVPGGTLQASSLKIPSARWNPRMWGRPTVDSRSDPKTSLPGDVIPLDPFFT